MEKLASLEQKLREMESHLKEVGYVLFFCSLEYTSYCAVCVVIQASSPFGLCKLLINYLLCTVRMFKIHESFLAMNLCYHGKPVFHSSFFKCCFHFFIINRRKRNEKFLKRKSRHSKKRMKSW